jgi:glucans biosynthesis protein
MLLSRRHILQCLIAMPSLGLPQPFLDAREILIPRGSPQPFRPGHVERLARASAARPFVPHRVVSSAWMSMHYEQYQQIHFRNEAALWFGSQIPFEAQLLLPGMLHRYPVEVFVVERDEAWPLYFSKELYRLPYPMPSLDPDEAGGFSGVRLLSAPHRQDGLAEFAVFQGGSYFRAVGRNQRYGLSARGLALGTADLNGEEFPVFRRIWLETPGQDADGVRLHALMESESLAGAYTFDVMPGGTTIMEVGAMLFPRVDLHKVGIAPMSSMFKFNLTNRWKFDDFRSGVHDSDGLLIATGAGGWNWRPLANPAGQQITRLADENPRGFGLMQRERDFESYGDLVSNYHERPSLWVEPKSPWGRGAVFLVELPTDTEVNDNIVAFWRPEEVWQAGSSHRLDYRLSWGWGPPSTERPARVLRTRLGRNYDGLQLVAIDFAPHPKLADASALKADVEVHGGRLDHTWVQRNENTGGLRLNFGFEPLLAGAVELRALLRRGRAGVTEAWLYRWSA